MTTLREAAKQALEALERLHGGCTDSDDGTVEAITIWVPEIITALRAALEKTMQEPVAWMYEDTLPKEYPYDAMWPHSAVRDGVRMFPVFAPPQRKPLTDKQKLDLATNWFAEDWAIEKALDLLDDYDYEIEQAHGIKE